jgi:hypothetical protein
VSTTPDPSWKHLGKTSNADFYEVASDVLAIVPFPDTKDDQQTARESVAFQDQHWRKVGRRGAIACFMDNVIEQDSGARSVYSDETKHSLTTCYALVGETFFGNAAAAVFTGLAPPGRPTNVFRSLADARSWIDEQNRNATSK